MATTKEMIHESARVILRINGSVARVIGLYSVKPRQGHATALMEKVIEFANEHSLHLVLDVQQFDNSRGLSNEQLIDFYRRFGFERSSLLEVRPVEMWRPSRGILSL